MKILIDMNLSPGLCQVLEQHGFESIHWSAVGDIRAPDSEIMDWAVSNNYVVLTHDLDFGAMLTATQAIGPSVIQVRTRNVLPEHLGPLLVNILSEHRSIIEDGALIVVDESRARIRILPLKSE